MATRSTDRLFALVQLIRGRRLSTTAACLAERLEVSERTVYRDVAALQAQGVPIEGEAGVGYRLGKGFDLPPLMFTTDEARALVAAVSIAQQWLDPGLVRAAQSALGRVMSVLPADIRASASQVNIIAPPVGVAEGVGRLMQQLRQAAESQHKVRVRYRDAAEQRTERILRPLACFYWGKVWTLAAWCEARQGFRNFRIDRIEELEALDARFAQEPGKTLQDLLAQADVPEEMRCGLGSVAH